MNVIMSDTEEKKNKTCSFFSKMYLSFQCLGMPKIQKNSHTHNMNIYWIEVLTENV